MLLSDDDDELSPEFKQQAERLFNEAVEQRVTQILRDESATKVEAILARKLRNGRFTSSSKIQAKRIKFR
jgi:hypothetical protein